MRALLILWNILLVANAEEPARKTWTDTYQGNTTTFLEQAKPKHGVFEQKTVDKNGELIAWSQKFVDEDGKVLVEVIRKEMGHDQVPVREGIHYIRHHTYRLDGKVDATVEFFGDGRLKHRTVYRYDEKGNLLGGDRFRDGKRVGWVHGTLSEPPEGFPKRNPKNAKERSKDEKKIP